MDIHPKARPLISKLLLPAPLPLCEVDIDLSQNTNPYLGEGSTYPKNQQDALKILYAQTILSLNPPPSFQEDPKTFLTPENILFTAGAMEGLDIVIRALAEPYRDDLCTFSPSFPAYEHGALLHGLQVKKVPLTGKNLDQIKIEKVIELAPKLLFVCHPNNPTGAPFRMEDILRLCRSLDGFVIVDEAYIEFSDRSSLLFYLKNHKNLVILRTFSKAWGLAGVRCGAVIADPSIIHALRHVQLPFTPSSVAYEKVQERLLNPQQVFESWEKNKRNRTRLIKDLSNLEHVTQIFHSETNFLLLILKDFQRTMERLQDHKIHVLDCSERVPDAIRVSLGNNEQNDAFLKVMRKS